MSSGFVSEADLAERRRIRNELWQSTRTEDDPEFPPEEEPNLDRRTLFERLQEQKAKKQEEWEEAHKLKNMVRGLEDDEVDFLEFVDNTKIQEEKRIRNEEHSALLEFRKKVAERQQKALETEIKAELKPEKKSPTISLNKKTSQFSLLAGAIKRKEPQAQSGSPNKRPKTESSTTNTKDPTSPSETELSSVAADDTSIKDSEVKNANKSALQCVAILPGLGNYENTDSSDSDCSDSDSDGATTPSGQYHRDLTGRIVKIHAEGKGGCC